VKYKLHLSTIVLSLALLGWAGMGSATSAEKPKGIEKIQHIVVIYLENHSFDNLYGLFPGADGIADARPERVLQVDMTGRPYARLPRVMDTRNEPPTPDRRFPSELPNRPFEIGRYVRPDQKIGDLTHRFFHHQAQINGGAMNRFAAVSDAGGLSMGYYDGRKLPLWQYARRYTLADHFFQAAFGGSFLNHFFLTCACTPRYENAPPALKVALNDRGELVRDGAVTADGYAVNTLQPAQGPRDPSVTDPNRWLPPQTRETIGDRLSGRNIPWAWYSGGWNDAVAGRPHPSFQFHHQPYVYFERYREGSDERRHHLKDETDFLAAIDKGELPAVVFYKPLGEVNEHPGYADLLTGERHVAEIIRKIEHSPLWKDTVIIVTYDEYGGFWDHVPPPPGDRWGPGSRVPTLIISPFAKRAHVDHAPYDTTSILKLIETRFDLQPLGERDAKANNLLYALDL
jgi:phospholipase C